jgi:formamidopyrimidine-DNA glycosylase
VPELPEVETVRRGLTKVTLNKLIWGGEVLLERSLASPVLSADFLAGITNTQITNWQRRGKYLLAVLERDHQAAGWLGIHLRMTGQLLWVDTDLPLARHTRVRLFLGDRQELRFIDQRTFGKLWYVPPTQQPHKVITALASLGAEPLEPDFTPQYLHRQLQRTQRAIKTALLDQRLVAGIGNIYADESLFLSGIHPSLPASNLSLDQVNTLHSSIVKVLSASIGQGGTTFSDFLSVEGVNGNYGGVAWVYGRAKEPCRVCGTPIGKLKLAGRSTHFCPHCQP